MTSAAGKLYGVENVTGQVDPSKVKYREIASGLDEPQGVQVVDGEIYVVEQNGLYRLADRNGDGFYEDRAAIASFLFSGTGTSSPSGCCTAKKK